MKSLITKLIFTLFFIFTLNFFGQNKILFDATKAEMAGNADWVIDSDLHNINATNGIPYVGGTESNPQRFPNPAQANIIASTTETYWQGALSSWAIDCVKKGYQVETLPYNGIISYGNTNNVQDLSNYKVFVVDEPNILFTPSEKTAIVNFVANGGGLFIISDHTISDRNNDGHDSPEIWNDLFTNNSIQNNAFGITFNLDNISGSSSNIASIPTNTILHGSYGNVSQVLWSNGATMTLNTSNNSSVKGLVYKTGASNTGVNNVMVASAVYQNGKVVAVGDSSIPDDGTGDPNDTLYDGYLSDANGNHRVLLMNAMVWLMTQTLDLPSYSSNNLSFEIAPNPIQNNQIKFNFVSNNSQNILAILYDSLGRVIKQIDFSNTNNSNNYLTIDNIEMQKGIYFLKLSNTEGSITQKFIVE
jgi:hypothetical protein